MPRFAVTILITACLVFRAAEAISAEPATGTPVPVCTQKQLVAYSPREDEISAHRQFVLPVIDYPFGTKLPGDWRLTVTARVDESGKAVCYSNRNDFGEIEPLNALQRGVIQQLAAWRYAQFSNGGRPVSAIVSEQVLGQEQVRQHTPLPKVAPNKVHIALERTACFGPCPIYRVDVYGDGRVVYQGGAYVDVLGKHSYRVSPEAVAHLVESLRNKDIWSLRPVYRSSITDNPTYILTIDLGGAVHRIEDYVGAAVGMPSSVSDFEDEVDRVAKSDMWLRVSGAAIAHLKAERFDFTSRAGADLLAYAIADAASHDDEAMLELIRLRAPVDGTARTNETLVRHTHQGVIEQALRNHRAILIEPLLSKGALNTHGSPDQDKIDAAFVAAIQGGRLDLVKKIWTLAGTKPHPSLTFDSVTRDGKSSHKRAPVTLALMPPFDKKSKWEGVAITKWLATLGCDLKAANADGNTLLDIAAEEGNADLVRYLLSQGMNPSIPGQSGSPPLSKASDEEVTLILLDAGADLARLDDHGRGFRAYAEMRRWPRVIAWLSQHGR